MYKFEHFAALINDPSESIIQPRDCHEALETLPYLVQAFSEEKKVLLLSFVNQQERNSTGSNSDSISNTGRTCLDLAISVFPCSIVGCQNRQRPLIAWQRAICHFCSHNIRNYWYPYGYSGEILEPTFTFSDRGSKAVKSLALLLELDAETTIPTDFDQVCLLEL